MEYCQAIRLQYPCAISGSSKQCHYCRCRCTMTVYHRWSCTDVADWVLLVVPRVSSLDPVTPFGDLLGAFELNLCSCERNLALRYFETLTCWMWI